MKFNPYSWSDSSSPRGSKSIIRHKFDYIGPFHHCFPIIFAKIYEGKKKLLTWL